MAVYRIHIICCIWQKPRFLPIILSCIKLDPAIYKKKTNNTKENKKITKFKRVITIIRDYINWKSNSDPFSINASPSGWLNALWHYIVLASRSIRRKKKISCGYYTANWQVIWSKSIDKIQNIHFCFSITSITK